MKKMQKIIDGYLHIPMDDVKGLVYSVKKIEKRYTECGKEFPVKSAKKGLEFLKYLSTQFSFLRRPMVEIDPHSKSIYFYWENELRDSFIISFCVNEKDEDFWTFSKKTKNKINTFSEVSNFTKISTFGINLKEIVSTKYELKEKKVNDLQVCDKAILFEAENFCWNRTILLKPVCVIMGMKNKYSSGYFEVELLGINDDKIYDNKIHIPQTSYRFSSNTDGVVYEYNENVMNRLKKLYHNARDKIDKIKYEYNESLNKLTKSDITPSYPSSSSVFHV